MSESLDILDIIGKDFTIVKIGNGLYSTKEHDSLRIWKDTNSFYWFSEHIGGNAITWLKYYHHLSEDTINETYEVYSVTPDPFKNIKLYNDTSVDISLLYGKKVYSDYIKNRGISYETFLKYDLEMINEYYCLIPLKNRFGKRIGALHRKLDDRITGTKYKKYYNDSDELFIFNYKKLQNNLNYGILILVFEGAWSAMRFEQVLGEDKVCCIATLSNKLDGRIFESLNGLSNVFIVLDNDKAGKELINKYPKQKFILPKIYPDEMTDEQIRITYERILTNAKQYTRKNEVAGFNICK